MLPSPRPLLFASAIGLLSLSPAPDDWGFRVDSATILEKTLEESCEWELTMIDSSMDGNPVTQDLPEVTGKVERSLEFSDEYASITEGKIKELQREFGDLSVTSRLEVEDAGERMEFDVKAESPLAESLVNFEWNELEERYDLEFEEGGGTEEDLAGLSIDTDLRSLLPEGEVEKGSKWKLTGDAFVDVFRIGGDHRFEVSEATEGSVMSVPTPAILATSLSYLGELFLEPDGEVTARFEGVEEIEGADYAIVSLSGGLTAQRDLTDLLVAAAEERASDAADFDSWKLESSVDATVEGKLLWSVKGGHYHSLVLEFDYTGEYVLHWTQSFLGQQSSFESEYENQGTTSLKLTASS